MRIAYGIFGYGRGHATRALAVLPELARRHELLLFAGGDAYDTLSGRFDVVRIPTLDYVYGEGGSRSVRRTVAENANRFREVVLGGASVQLVAAQLSAFRPDVAICDAEPWTHAACARLGIPRIGFDHFGVLAWCRPPVKGPDRYFVMRDVLTYRLLIGRPDRVIVSSFYDAPPRRPSVRVIAPLLRDEVLGVKPQKGEHVLVYFNRGQYQLTPRIEEALQGLGVPVVVYGSGRAGAHGNLSFRPPADRQFVEDLARSVAVVSTAGNQLVGEAMHFGKAMLVMPENSVEQRMNAHAVARLGIGEDLHHARLDGGVLRRFLARAQQYGARALSLRRDGRAEAIEALETFAAQLAVTRRSAPTALALAAWRFA